MSSLQVNQQVGPNSAQPYSNQQNFGEVVGELSAWATHAPIPFIQNIVNNRLRNYLDKRMWYGSLRKGILQSPGYYSTGTITMTNSSNVVTGTGTNWTDTINGVPIIGMQLRLGFVYPIFTITGTDLLSSPQTLTIDQLWMQPNLTTSYFLCQMYYSIPNCEFVYSLRNLMMMTRIWTNIPVTLLDTFDPSRLQLYMPRILAAMPPDPSGNWVGELWPAPNVCQPFPYLASVVVPKLKKDSDNFPAFTRCDVIKAGALSEVILYKPKENPSYSESFCLALSDRKAKEYREELESAAQKDEGRFRQDLIRAEEAFPLPNMDWRTGALIGGGAYLSAMSAVSADGGEW